MVVARLERHSMNVGYLTDEAQPHRDTLTKCLVPGSLYGTLTTVNSPQTREPWM